MAPKKSKKTEWKMPSKVRDSVLLAVAASAKNVKVNLASGTTSPPNLLDRKLNDSRIGIRGKAGIDAWRSNLAAAMPELAGPVGRLELDPNLTIGQIGASLAAAVERAPMVWSKSAMAEARKKLRDAHGRDLSEKVTQSALRYLTAARRESVTSEGRLIVECERSLVPAAPLELPRLERLAMRRDYFYRYLSPIRATLERIAGAGAVEVCWLNRTMRVAGIPKAIAEVASDAGLIAIDMPHRMKREMNVCGPSVGAPAFRQATGKTGAGVVIGVIDGEVQADHPALLHRVTLQKDYSGEGFGRPDNHGTAVAGVAASADPIFTGIAPGASIFNYKVFGRESADGSGVSNANDFDGADALLQALSDNVHIANCSWGYEDRPTDGTSREALACDEAWREGMVVVKSAGNTGPGAGTMTVPGDAEGVIVVGATDRSGFAVADYSSRGPCVNGRQRPHLLAPGGLSIDQIRSLTPNGGVGQVGRGTSLAAPIVSGLAALILEGNLSLTPNEVRAIMLRNCRAFPGNDPNTHGAGFVSLRLPS